MYEEVKVRRERRHTTPAVDKEKKRKKNRQELLSMLNFTLSLQFLSFGARHVWILFFNLSNVWVRRLEYW